MAAARLLLPARGAWAHGNSAAAASEPPAVAPLGDRVEAQNPPRFSRNSLLKMEAPCCTEPASRRACGRAASGPEAAGRAPDPEARARVGQPRATSPGRTGLRRPLRALLEEDKPIERSVVCGGPPSPPRPTLPRRIIGCLISPGLILGSVEGGLQREIKLDRSIFSKRGSETGGKEIVLFCTKSFRFPSPGPRGGGESRGEQSELGTQDQVAGPCTQTGRRGQPRGPGRAERQPRASLRPATLRRSTRLPRRPAAWGQAQRAPSWRAQRPAWCLGQCTALGEGGRGQAREEGAGESLRPLGLAQSLVA